MIKDFLKMNIKWNGKFLIKKLVYYLKKSLILMKKLWITYIMMMV